MNDAIDEQLLRRALIAFADCRAPAQPHARRRVRPLRLSVVLLAAVLLIAGSAVAAQRAVLEPLGVFVGSDSRYTHVRDRDFVRRINEGALPQHTIAAGLVMRVQTPRGEVRVYALTNEDGGHAITISQDGLPQGYVCCTSDAGVRAPVSVGAQMGRSTFPVAYPDTWAGWVGDRTSEVDVLYSDGSTTRADVANGYFLATDEAPPGADPVALIARDSGGSELGREAIARG